MSDENKNFRYHYLKKGKRCVKCQKRDERTLSGKILCNECSEKDKGYHNEYLKKLREERKAKGLCVDCQKRDERTLSGKRLCNECSEKYKVNHNEYLKKLREERKAKGLCVYCGKPAFNGTVRCEKHRQEFIDYLERRKQRTRKNWGGLNE